MACRNFEFDLNTFLLALVYIVGVIMIFKTTSSNELTEKAKSDKYKLTCYMEDGWRTIPKEKIVGFDDNSLYWVFTNGHARNCVLEEVEE